MKISVLAVVLALACSASAEALEHAPTTNDVATARDLNAFVQYEVRNRQIESELAPIRSMEDLNNYVREMPPSSPLRLLSPVGRDHFLNSITFNENGITGYDYSDLVAELNAKNIYRVLSLFGAQRTTAILKGVRVRDQTDQLIMSQRFFNSPYLGADHENYRCESRATCGQAVHMICMSGC